MEILTDEELKDLDKSMQIISSLSITINTFQDFFKKKSGNFILLDEMLQNVEPKFVKPIFYTNNIEHIIKNKNESIFVDDRLIQVLLNLYQNASDALKGKR